MSRLIPSVKLHDVSYLSSFFLLKRAVTIPSNEIPATAVYGTIGASSPVFTVLLCAVVEVFCTVPVPFPKSAGLVVLGLSAGFDGFSGFEGVSGFEGFSGFSGLLIDIFCSDINNIIFSTFYPFIFLTFYLTIIDS